MKASPRKKHNSEHPQNTTSSQHTRSFKNLLTASLAFGHSLLSHLDSKTRLGLSIMLGMVAFLGMPDSMHFDNRILISWISGILCFLSLVVLMICNATPQKTRYRAQRQEAQHLAVFMLVVMTACTSIFAIGLMQAVSDTKNISASTQAIEVSLSLIAVIGSWFLTHTMFALHYATCYYRQDFLNEELGYAGGLDFPGDDLPDYWDFMYFSFTLGMTAQTSDVSIPSLSMRRLALGHGMISFFFYMVILASSVNIASGLL